MKNIDLFVRILQESGVKWVFGIPSDPVLPLIESLRTSNIKYVLTASETSAAFMAATVGRLTGVPGVCVSTLGPGATNLATGVGCAWLDRNPIIAITCNVPTPMIERRTQMRIDHHALFRPLTKLTVPLRSGQIADSLSQALCLASSEPPGPVHLDLPIDVALADTKDGPKGERSSSDIPDIPSEVIKVIVDSMKRCKKPLVVTGLTLSRCQSIGRLLSFIERQNLPFISTLHAKGYLPEHHPNWVGVLGRARRSNVQAFIREADLIIAIGFDPVEINYEDWVEGKPVIHLSTELAEVATGVEFLGNWSGALDRTFEHLVEIPPIQNDWSPSNWAIYRQDLERSLRPHCEGLAPHHVLDILREKIPSNAILVYDIGAHTHQIGTQWRTDLPGTCLSTNGWSSMGYGMPAAYAAKLVHPDRVVVGVVGDGCFQMTVGELATAKRLGLAVPIIVLNDGWLGLIKVKQEHKGYGYSGVYLGAPSISPSHYFGVPCRSVRNESELKEVLAWGLTLDGPSVIEVFIDVAPYSQTVFD